MGGQPGLPWRNFLRCRHPEEVRRVAAETRTLPFILALYTGQVEMAMFRDREEAAGQIAERLAGERDIVLASPRRVVGGDVTGLRLLKKGFRIS